MIGKLKGLLVKRIITPPSTESADSVAPQLEALHVESDRLGRRKRYILAEFSRLERAVKSAK